MSVKFLTLRGGHPLPPGRHMALIYVVANNSDTVIAKITHSYQMFWLLFVSLEVKIQMF
jgi:hypothetical protein